MGKERLRLSWDESFMMHAILAASRSSCIHLWTGAVVVSDKRVIASGYNRAPPNIENCLTRGCRKDREKVEFDDKGKSVCRGTHAEINAMNQIARQDLIGTIMYTLYFPCSSCAKAIAGNGIHEVVYARIYKEQESLTREIFAEGGIKLRQLEIDIENCLETIRLTYCK